jgi:type IV secretory system conjugative DNA transfer VirD4/TraG family protein
VFSECYELKVVSAGTESEADPQKVHIVDPFRMLERPVIASRLSIGSRLAGRFAS